MRDIKMHQSRGGEGAIPSNSDGFLLGAAVTPGNLCFVALTFCLTIELRRAFGRRLSKSAFAT